MISPTQVNNSSQSPKQAEDSLLKNRIEQTLLSPTAGEKQFIELLEQAHKLQFFGVCIPPSRVSWAKDFISAHRYSLKLVSVVGFPHGNSLSDTKAFEAQTLVTFGADEIDMVMNLHFFKDLQFQKVVEDIKLVKKAIEKTPLKVIIETALLSKDEIVNATKICAEVGADFVKTCTGFQAGSATQTNSGSATDKKSSGATIEDIQLIRRTLDESAHTQVKIKASGGIRSRSFALSLIEAGADRLGTSSGALILNSSSSVEPSSSPTEPSSY